MAAHAAHDHERVIGWIEQQAEAFQDHLQVISGRKSECKAVRSSIRRISSNLFRYGGVLVCCNRVCELDEFDALILHPNTPASRHGTTTREE